MDGTRRNWLKGLAALPALIAGRKLLPAVEKVVAPEEELPMVRKGVMPQSQQNIGYLPYQTIQSHVSYTVTSAFGYKYDPNAPCNWGDDDD